MFQMVHVDVIKIYCRCHQFTLQILFVNVTPGYPNNYYLGELNLTQVSLETWSI